MQLPPLSSIPVHRLAVWRGPRDQPAWARPLLLAIAAAAAWSYSWRATRPVDIEIYYAAAVRSMTTSLPDFFFGAFDPAGIITTDKLPGAFWLQAISAGVLGPHRGALVLPQVIEGTATVLVLYRAVRRVSGPAAGLIAAAILALSPAVVALNRGNVSDTLMILLSVLAADALLAALGTGRWRPLLLAAIFTGLAFQAKMIQAWLILPALAVTYLLAAPGGWRPRVVRCVAMLGTAVAVSLSWMTLVTIWPAGDRPYVDGSTSNSVFQQVFGYNGFGRLDQATPDQLVNATIRLGIPVSPAPSPGRLLTGALGRDAGWLLAAAVIALAAGLVARRREQRTDQVRAALLLWGLWLIASSGAFTVATTVNSYYLAALAPPVAALLATGLTLAWQHRARRPAWLVLAAAVAATAAYAAWLVPGAGTGLPGWLRPVSLVLAAVAVVLIAAAASWPARRALAAVTIAAAAVAALAVPAVAAWSVTASGLGPFETPFEPAKQTADITSFLSAGFTIGPALTALERGNAAQPYLMATQTAVLAAPFIWASGREVVPVGGFTGTIPAPTLTELRHLIATNFVRTVLQAPGTTDPRLVWVARNCVRITRQTPGRAPVLPLAAYFCLHG